MTMDRRGFLSGVAATLGAIALPEPPRVRAYSFLRPAYPRWESDGYVDENGVKWGVAGAFTVYDGLQPPTLLLHKGTFEWSNSDELIVERGSLFAIRDESTGRVQRFVGASRGPFRPPRWLRQVTFEC